MKLGLTTAEWIALPDDMRFKLRDMFRVGKSGACEVMNGKLINDGTTAKDLQAMQLGNLIEKLGNDLPWHNDNLFDELLSLILNKPNDVQEATTTGTYVGPAPVVGDASHPAQPRTRGRRKKEARQGTPVA